jgi:hypothetical protein
MPKLTLKHVTPDAPLACPGCGRTPALSDVRDDEMFGTCLLDSCRQRMTYRLVNGAWKIVDRSTMPAISG